MSRRLTLSKYNAAWHAVEAAAGREDADPGVVLHAVLASLDITPPEGQPLPRHANPYARIRDLVDVAETYAVDGAPLSAAERLREARALIDDLLK
ncbi:hypothetical protein [Streptomyces zaomyceticus]|uniref:hypothetical protein n=1 Tax=Streptomyces zaomyceticus TaxID=68286 RepID=UPI002E1DA6B8